MNWNDLHHTAIITSDLAKTKEFYVEKLGFSVLCETARKEKGDVRMDLALGNIRLEVFVKPDAPKRLSNPEALGLRHLAFQTDDLEGSIRALEEMGIPCEPIRFDPETGGRATFFADPDGLPLELHE